MLSLVVATLERVVLAVMGGATPDLARLPYHQAHSQLHQFVESIERCQARQVVVSPSMVPMSWCGHSVVDLLQRTMTANEESYLGVLRSS